MENKDKRQVIVPVQGSLGILALGHTGLDLWREAKKNAPKVEQEEEKDQKTDDDEQ